MNQAICSPAPKDGPASGVTTQAPALWKLVPLWFIVALIVSSPAIGASVINAHMADALNMDRTQLGAGFSLFIAMMALSAPVVAVGFRYFGIRRIALIGVSLATLGTLLLATVVNTGPSFILAYGLVLGLGVGAAGVVPVQTVVASWFPQHRALAVSVVLSAIDFAAIVAAPTFAWLIVSPSDWRLGWWVTLVCMLVAAALILWVIPGRLSTVAHAMGDRSSIIEARKSRVYKTAVSWPVGEAIRTRQYVALLLYSLATCIVWVFFMSHGVKYLQSLNYSAADAATTISIIVAASLGGNIVAGLLGDKIPPHLMGAVAMLLLGAGIALAQSPSGFSGLVVFGVLFGFGYGGAQVCWITTLTNYFGPAAFPILYGVALSSGAIGGTLGGIGGGMVYDRFQTYSPAFVFCIAFTVVIALLQLAASPRTIRREPLPTVGQ